MQVSRIVIKNFRSLKSVDIQVAERTSCVVGENNTVKSNFIHALRLCLDVTLSSAYRALVKDDIHCDVDQNRPFQVLIGVELTGFRGRDNEEAILHGTQIGDDRARLFYRFRPKRAVREAIAARARAPNTLTLADYAWELAGGGNPDIGLHQIRWNTDNDAIGASNVGLTVFAILPGRLSPCLTRCGERSSQCSTISARQANRSQRDCRGRTSRACCCYSGKPMIR